MSKISLSKVLSLPKHYLLLWQQKKILLSALYSYLNFILCVSVQMKCLVLYFNFFLLIQITTMGPFHYLKMLIQNLPYNNKIPILKIKIRSPSYNQYNPDLSVDPYQQLPQKQMLEEKELKLMLLASTELYQILLLGTSLIFKINMAALIFRSMDFCENGLDHVHDLL